MLRTLFPRHYSRYEQSCYAGELKEFGCWLFDAGYSRKNTRDHLRRLRFVVEQAPLRLPDQMYTAEQLTLLFALPHEPAWRSILNTATRRLYERFLRSQGRLDPGKQISDPCTACLDDYASYLRDVRGLAQTTTEQHLATISEFLIHSLDAVQTVADLTSGHVEQYLSSKSAKLTRQTLQHTVARLRAFLRYSFDIGLLAVRLDRIDRPRTYRDEQPPRAMPWLLVLKLLRSIDRKSKAGWRDYTILHLMAHYGLRPSEVAALKVDSVDFKAKLLQVNQRKTHSHLTLPISGSTLRVLQSYLKRGRPVSSDTPLFLRVRRPTGGITHYTVCDLFNKRSRQGGLPAGQYSSYSLRHAFAMRLLQRGVGVKAIGDLLGHRSLESTCVYLRLDVKTLRKVALPVPHLARTGG